MESYLATIQEHPRLWALWRKMAPSPAAEVASMMGFESLLQRYAEPQRFYHTIDHLYDLAEQFEQYEATFGEDSIAVIAALFFHDAVYKGVHGKDEADSAALAKQVLPYLDLGQRDVQRAVDIILMTAQHAASAGDHAAQLFLDMDMSILGADPERYARYADNVFREYTYERYTAAEMCVGRAAFLHNTLEQGAPIFKTAEYAHLGSIAKRNMSDEIVRLNARKTQLDVAKYQP